MKTIEEINETIKYTYDLVAEKYHKLFQNEMNEKEYDQILLNSFADKLTKGSLICDAGCGPSAHIGKYLFDKGMEVTGVDISQRCIEIASALNTEMQFICEDIGNLSFKDESFDGVVSYYSIIHTPKKLAFKIFDEFYRILKTNGYLLVAVKAGQEEGFINELLDVKTEIYFSLFSMDDIEGYFRNSDFHIEFMEKRKAYKFEAKNERIFAIGRKI